MVRIRILNNFPEVRNSDLLVAFYALLSTSQGESYIMNKESLLKMSRESEAALSWATKKDIVDIGAYGVEEEIPVLYESRVDTFSNMWMMIGISVAVMVPMVMIIILLCR